MRYLITFSYDGSKFNGYQKQIDKNTIQDKLEEALTEINKKEVFVSATGRTDAKVHAYNQKAHFDLDITIEEENLKRAINSLIGNYIYVKHVKKVNDNFHARFDCFEKTYTYKINVGEYNPIECDYVYQYCKCLDVSNMKQAIQYLIGEHNFKSFTKADDIKDDYKRTIYKATIEQQDNYIYITFTGNGFMRYMVRNIVGTLIEVGENKRKPEEIIVILNSMDRKVAGKTAPANGLYLIDAKISNE